MIINPIPKGGKGLTPEIIVTAPSGSTIDLMQGSLVLHTYTLSNTEAQHTFTVKNTGTYTVRGTSGSDTASVEVVVDAIGQFSCTIEYFNGLKLYWYGDECADVTGGWGLVNKSSSYPGSIYFGETSITVTGGSASSQCDAGMCTINPLMMDNYTTLNVEVVSVDLKSTAKYALWATRTRAHDSYLWNNSTVTFSTAGVITLPITKTGKNGYVYISAPPSSSSMVITKVWLE